ncbi:TetR/AcrR family transcriptional regulator [Nonomuraea dietziae]|uniref:AcrR family transcriptional regulator n=1 Tax=Nonomuraea dietziae TaxID=65515 RepID=A0A7W5YD46_9ACTN|nr:TetR/AcrR family transcriptional regulator [Nonomuraea dietziae]MBB3730013.1 AcrR family transcriptional regulator [Nonomuraea dietziae]
MPHDGKRVKGSADERAQARDRLRAELLAAARALAEEKGGYEGVTIRALADRVGYRAPVVYEYFANKRDLLLALIEAGFAECADALAKALCAHEQRRAGGVLPAVAEAYWSFSLSQPHLYRLMHSLSDVPFGAPATPAPAQECFVLLRNAVTEAAPRHPATAYDADAATDLFWAHLHGLVMLTLDGRIKGGPTRAHGLLGHLTDTFTGNGARSGPR